jgi:hypothetical protein
VWVRAEIVDCVPLPRGAHLVAVLVKFDKPLRGPQDEEYRKLAENIGNRGSGARFLVGEVNIQGYDVVMNTSHSRFLTLCVPSTDHSDRLNDVLRERYQLTLADLPKFLLFKRGRSVMDAARYNGEFNEKAILKWLRSGAHSSYSSTLVPLLVLCTWMRLCVVS